MAGRSTHRDITADDFDIVAITIPGNGDPARTLLDLINDGYPGAASIQTLEIWDRIIAWEIFTPSIAYNWSRLATMAVQVAQAADAKLQLPVSKTAIPNVYVQSQTGVAVTAFVLLYLAELPGARPSETDLD